MVTAIARPHVSAKMAINYQSNLLCMSVNYYVSQLLLHKSITYCISELEVDVAPEYLDTFTLYWKNRIVTLPKIHLTGWTDHSLQLPKYFGSIIPKMEHKDLYYKIHEITYDITTNRTGKETF